eukprot:2972193-Pyramimonas_sp.AAC.1
MKTRGALILPPQCAARPRPNTLGKFPALRASRTESRGAVCAGGIDLRHLATAERDLSEFLR